MGHGYYGDKFHEEEFHEKKFAWWPVHSSVNKTQIWLKTYYIIHIQCDETIGDGVYRQGWELIYDKNEYLMYLLKRETDE